MLALAAALSFGLCSEMRLDKTSHFARMPLQNQGRLNTCYAHVATQLIDAKREAAPTERASSIETALGTKLGDASATGPDWGTPCDAVNYLATNGICPEYLVPPAFRIAQGIAERIRNLSRYHAYFHQMRDSAVARDIIVTSVRDYLEHHLAVSGAFLPSKATIASSLLHDSPAAFMKEIVAFGCAGSSRLKAPAVSCHTTKTDKLETVHSNLDRKEPVAITYCLDDRGQENNPQCIKHSALVIGRRPTSQGGCELLVRDSRGRDSDVWIAASQLSQRLSSVSFLKQ